MNCSSKLRGRKFCRVYLRYMTGGREARVRYERGQWKVRVWVWAWVWV